MDYVTIKVRAGTRAMLRAIAAYTGEQMTQVAERLCEAEVARLSKLIEAEGGLVLFVSHERKGKTHVTQWNSGEKADDNTGGATGSSTDSTDDA